MTAADLEKRHDPQVAIRDFQPEDYPAIVEIANAAYPDHPTTVEERRFEDENFDRTKYVWRRYVGADPSTGRVISEAEYNHLPWSYDPLRFGIWVAVHPGSRRRGIGGLLYERVLEDLRTYDATQIRSSCQETMTPALAFLKQRGFRELRRSWESRLDVRAFDFAPFAKYWEPPPGTEIVTLQEELAKGSDCVRQVYDMDSELSLDEPRYDPFTPIDFGMWRQWVLESPRALPEAFFLAKDGDRYVGQSNFERNETLADVLYTGFTCVRREYRGRGIAMALKLRAIEYAKSRGCREIRTWNSTLNAPMLGINVKLGFVKQPAWIALGKDGGAAG